MDIEASRRFCLHLVRFMSGIAMDPHLYFEKKMSAEIMAAGSAQDLMRRMDRLVDWIGASGLTDAQIRRLDAALTAGGLPTFSAVVGDARRRARPGAGAPGEDRNG